jgi:CelD/BcsL family acetyltransferase involved in cellulose biosynthesis
MISFKVLEGREAIQQYYPQWQELLASGSHEPSLSIPWTEALLHSFLEGHPVSLIVLADSTGIAGLVPLYVKEIKKAGMSLSTLSPVAEHFNTHSDLLLRDSSTELAEAFLNAVLSVPVKWDVFRINRFLMGHPLFQSLESVLKNKFDYAYRIQSEAPSFFIELAKTKDEFLKTVSRKLREDLRRHLKKLRSAGDVSFHSIRDFHDFDKLFDTIQRIEEASWKHKHGTGISSTEKSRQFYKELCRGEMKYGRLRVAMLCLKHIPIAYEMGLVYGKKYYCLHGSYDESYKKNSPGAVLLAQLIEDLIQEGIEELDSFGEPFAHIQHWTDKYRWHRSILIYNRTPKAKLFQLVTRLKSTLRPVKEDKLVLRNPRDITRNDQ